MEQGLLHFQLGVQLTALQTQVQQLLQVIQTQAAQLQETRDLLESLGKVCGLEWSPDLKQWVSSKKLAALKSSPLDSPSE
mgnify:CR=1 FL=1